MTEVPSIKGRAAIVGVGEVAPMKTPDGRDGLQLAVEAGKMAIQDAGMERSEVDGLLIIPPMEYVAQMALPSYLAEMLNLPLRYGDRVDIMGASGAGMVWRAAAAISAGMCHSVLCIGGDAYDPKMMQAAKFKMGDPDIQFETPYGSMAANSSYALIAQRHAYEYGTTDRQRARVAVDQRANACANPKAVFYGQPLTVDDVLNSRIVCHPLHLLEIVRPCTGASAWVVTSAERAKRGPHAPVKLLGAGEYITHDTNSWLAKSITTTPVTVTAQAAFQMAGLMPKDIDLASIYDCYTIMVMITLEDAGFCKKGKAGGFVEEHDLTYKGDLPVNTHGGQMSYGQAGNAGGMTQIMEAVYQLRGEAGQRQVKDCELAFVNGNGGYVSEECSLILGR